MITEIGPGLRFILIFTVLTGLLYPLAITGIAQLIFPKQANGSLVTVDDKLVGSSLIGQNFSRAEYFHPRPSSAGSGYDAAASGGSNLGPTSARLLRGAIKVDSNNNEIVDFDGIALRIVHYCFDNELPFQSSVPLDKFKKADGQLDDVELLKAFNDAQAPLVFRPTVAIPPDAVTGSASGLDPHISPANASIQARRVARARNVTVDRIQPLIAEFTTGPDFGVLGEPRVNVLMLNLAMDRQFPASHQ